MRGGESKIIFKAIKKSTFLIKFISVQIKWYNKLKVLKRDMYVFNLKIAKNFVHRFKRTRLLYYSQIKK